MIKPFILFALLSAFTLQAFSQRNSIKLGFQLEHNFKQDVSVPNIMLEYDRNICKKLGVYATLQYGKLNANRLYGMGNSFTNYGVTLGVNYTLVNCNRYKLLLGAGGNYRRAITDLPGGIFDWDNYTEFETERLDYLGLQLGVTNQYHLSKRLLLELNVNYNSFFNSMQTAGVNLKAGYKF